MRCPIPWAPARICSSDGCAASKIVLEANPGFRGFVWDFQPGADAEDRRIVAEMKGKKMPQVGRVEISIIEEDQARLLAFERGELDIMNMEAPLASMVLDGDKLKPDFVRRGVKLSRIHRSGHHLYLLEHAGSGVRRLCEGKDRVAAGDGDGFRALMTTSGSCATARRSKRSTRFPPAWSATTRTTGPTSSSIPPAPTRCSIASATRRGADGFRTLPDGKPMVIRYSSRPDTLGRLQDELWEKAFALIGIRMEVQKLRFPDQIKAEKDMQAA